MNAPRASSAAINGMPGAPYIVSATREHVASVHASPLWLLPAACFALLLTRAWLRRRHAATSAATTAAAATATAA
ncbi:hypothetical protein EON66_04420 [archaeon]|nr:MAG: hypothetical protein EON66_04420 [archaeon]